MFKKKSLLFLKKKIFEKKLILFFSNQSQQLSLQKKRLNFFLCQHFFVTCFLSCYFFFTKKWPRLFAGAVKFF